METIFLKPFILLLVLSSISLSVPSQKVENAQMLEVSFQQRIPSDLDEGAYILANDIQEWASEETAIIICDMWDQHWCPDATARVKEMAPFMNNVVSLARDKRILIVHAPSGCMGYYKDYLGRKEAKKYSDKKIAVLANGDKLPSEEGAVWPVDQSDEGCENGGAKPFHAWKKQIDALTFKDQDLISDSGNEIGTCFKEKGIKNVILIGVHTNMCVIGRSFGLRAMKKMGYNVVLMRDMTDLMYNQEMAPYVDHFSGLDLIVEYIETYVCPSVLSCDFTGQKQFRFKEDKRPIVAFVTAESEYRANQCLPEFAHELLLYEGVNSEFAIGKPIMEGEGRHNIENLQILKDADLAVIFVRRRALPEEQMSLIKGYIESGKPVLGIRTASHAFDAKGNVARKGGGITQAKEQASQLLSQWPEFDKEILGGNYQGHYGHLKELTVISIVPGMENRPLLKNVPNEGFESPNWLYRNRPLRSENAQVLLVGTIPNEPAEPVLWINKTGKNNVIYTSLGHWDDWKTDAFKNLMINSVHYLLETNQ